MKLARVKAWSWLKAARMLIEEVDEEEEECDDENEDVDHENEETLKEEENADVTEMKDESDHHTPTRPLYASPLRVDTTEGTAASPQIWGTDAYDELWNLANTLLTHEEIHSKPC